MNDAEVTKNVAVVVAVENTEFNLVFNIYVSQIG